MCKAGGQLSKQGADKRGAALQLKADAKALHRERNALKLRLAELQGAAD